MTPREGNWAVDTRNGQLGRVVKKRWRGVELCPPDGGDAWDCPDDRVRIATKSELQKAGLWRSK
ncbi:hypothetical protein [Streptomyces thioluteus]